MLAANRNESRFRELLPFRQIGGILARATGGYMIKGLHHNAYRCRDSEETRAFYEDFLGFRFVGVSEIDPSAVDEGTLHTFFQTGKQRRVIEIPEMLKWPPCRGQ